MWGEERGGKRENENARERKNARKKGKRGGGVLPRLHLFLHLRLHVLLRHHAQDGGRACGHVSSGAGSGA